MENIVEKEIKKLSPYFKGLAYDPDTDFLRLSVALPINWNVQYLYDSEIVLTSGGYDELNNVYMLGLVAPDSGNDYMVIDKPIDFFLNKIKELIDYNLEEEKKRELIKNKMEELSQYLASASLEDLEKFNPVKNNPIKVNIENKISELNIDRIDKQEVNTKKLPRIKQISK